MKLIIFFLALSCSINLLSQSKKKQIQILSNRIDSLNNVLLKEEQSISEKSSKIVDLEKKITKKDLEINNLKNEISLKSEELSKNKTHTEELRRKNKNKIDSLSELLVQQIENRNKNINLNPYRIDYSIFSKPAKNKNDGIEEWLEHFNLISTNSIELLDKEVSDHYGGSSNSDIDTYGIVQIKTDMYKEGIIYRQLLMYEDGIFELEIPLMKLKEAEKVFNLLLINSEKKSGAHLDEPKFEQIGFGVKISWGFYL